MAILGFQLVSTLIAASILSKVINYMSFARYILCLKLFRYIHPSSNEVFKAANINRTDKSNGKKNKRNNDNNNDELNHMILKSTNFELKKIPVMVRDLVQLHYYSDYQWLLDFSICCMLVYVANEFVYGVITESVGRVNLSIIWVLLGLGFTIRCLISTNSVYFSMNDSADAMIVILSAFTFLVMAMVVLILPENIIDFDLKNAHLNLTGSINKAFLTNDTTKSAPLSEISISTLKGILVICSALIGGFLTHSGLRFGKMYLDSIARSSKAIYKLMLHFSFVLPTAIACLWLKPVEQVFLNARIGSHKMQIEDLYSLRLYLLICFVILRFVLSRNHLQSYLNLAEERVQSLRKEAGKISVLEYQKIIARIFYCLCLVAVQYFAPVLLVLYLGCLYKQLSGFSWIGSLHLPFYPLMKSTGNADSAISVSSMILPWMGDLAKSVEAWTHSVGEFRGIFSAVFFHAIMGYLVWFTLMALQLTSLLGLVYHRNLLN